MTIFFFSVLLLMLAYAHGYQINDLEIMTCFVSSSFLTQWTQSKQTSSPVMATKCTVVSSWRSLEGHASPDTSLMTLLFQLNSDITVSKWMWTHVLLLVLCQISLPAYF
jgi:hypothetical protein